MVSSYSKNPTLVSKLDKSNRCDMMTVDGASIKLTSARVTNKQDGEGKIRLTLKFTFPRTVMSVSAANGGKE